MSTMTPGAAKPQSFLDKLQAAVNLPFVLKVLGVALLGVTVWKGVHGFFPTTGIIIGGAMLLVGSWFNKIYP